MGFSTQLESIVLGIGGALHFLKSPKFSLLGSEGIVGGRSRTAERQQRCSQKAHAHCCDESRVVHTTSIGAYCTASNWAQFYDDSIDTCSLSHDGSNLQDPAERFLTIFTILLDKKQLQRVYSPAGWFLRLIR